VEYNEDYSIDTLDDSQWLVTLTYNENDIVDNNNLNQDILSEINNLITIPQTKYKIYTNYVDSIPEGYFYCRKDKNICLKYQDYYTGEILEPIIDQGDYKIVPNLSRDILITCNVHDINDNSKNYVSLKSYRYIISLLDKTIINSDNGEIIKNESNIITVKY
jgi:hypothetical protein